MLDGILVRALSGAASQKGSHVGSRHEVVQAGTLPLCLLRMPCTA